MPCRVRREPCGVDQAGPGSQDQEHRPPPQTGFLGGVHTHRTGAAPASSIRMVLIKTRLGRSLISETNSSPPLQRNSRRGLRWLSGRRIRFNAETPSGVPFSAPPIAGQPDCNAGLMGWQAAPAGRRGGEQPLPRTVRPSNGRIRCRWAMPARACRTRWRRFHSSGLHSAISRALAETYLTCHLTEWQTAGSFSSFCPPHRSPWYFPGLQVTATVRKQLQQTLRTGRRDLAPGPKLPSGQIGVWAEHQARHANHRLPQALGCRHRPAFVFLAEPPRAMALLWRPSLKAWARPQAARDTVRQIHFAAVGYARFAVLLQIRPASNCDVGSFAEFVDEPWVARVRSQQR